ncbi:MULTISPECIES: tetratricopeptide repeat protein [unclassified Actinomyces]|uniref:tetratricopeptide repeat protein n=1 Tax=unclassified Actinomyces TaxID=2609248 RepID=UPI000D58DA12|nr:MULTISPECIES: tetratricopeptide repeat protein [unclassified Actinomyces]RAX23664.1 tetratricopeptide repeat protein [Actinomyces sp. Z3]
MTQAQDSAEQQAAGTADQPDREALAAFLATAPEELKGWAAAQLDALQPTAEATGEAAGEADAPDGGTAPSGPDAQGDSDSDVEAAADVEDLLADDDDAAPRPRRSASAGRERTPSAIERRTGVSRLNLALVALLAAAVVIIVQQAGRGDTASTALPEGHPSVAATAAASAVAAMDEAEPVDAEREAELRAQAEADPEDIESRQELGVMYLKAALYQDSITWLQQILDLDPDNLDALLTIGVAEYQSNQYEEAETHWLRASEIDPEVAEPWYNLGFLYMARTPPDAERANQCWEKVLQLAPDSEMAANVRGHVTTMGSATATPSAG